MDILKVEGIYLRAQALRIENRLNGQISHDTTCFRQTSIPRLVQILLAGPTHSKCTFLSLENTNGIAVVLENGLIKSLPLSPSVSAVLTYNEGTIYRISRVGDFTLRNTELPFALVIGG